MQILVRIDQRKDGEIIPIIRHTNKDHAAKLIADLYAKNPDNIYTISFERLSLKIGVK